MTTALLKKIFLILITIVFTTPVLSDDKMDLGLEVFNNKATCGTCHVLKTAESIGNIGPCAGVPCTGGLSSISTIATSPTSSSNGDP